MGCNAPSIPHAFSVAIFRLFYKKLKLGYQVRILSIGYSSTEAIFNNYIIMPKFKKKTAKLKLRK